MKKLREIAKIISGHPFRSKIEQSRSGDTLVIQMKDLVGRDIDWREAVETTVDNVKEERFVKEGDILLVARGSKNTAVLINSLPRPALCSPHFYIIRIEEHSEINPFYLHWYINQRPAQLFFERNAQGSNIQSISRDAIQSLPIPDVSIEKQESIAALTNKLYEHQQTLQKLIDNDQRIMDGIAQSLMSSE